MEMTWDHEGKITSGVLLFLTLPKLVEEFCTPCLIASQNENISLEK